MLGFDGGKNVASSSKRYPISDPADFYKQFPKLTADNHHPTSPATPEPDNPRYPYRMYNCFAYVAGDKKRPWWPGGRGYWPRYPSQDTVEELMYVLAKMFDYEECADGSFEPGVKKVAIFEQCGLPVHIAFQPTDRKGVWKSKMGLNVDMEHALDLLEARPGREAAEAYGTVVRFMRQKPKRKALSASAPDQSGTSL
jgi:hypothetical protein